MHRFHVNVTVKDLERSVAFYRALFGQGPTVEKTDYAKWMLEDPRINFSVSTSTRSRGVNHIGLQADTMAELEQIQERLRLAEETTFDQPDAQCCYARSSKTWVRDPDAVAWETFVTHEDIAYYGDDHAPTDVPANEGERCCA